MNARYVGFIGKTSLVALFIFCSKAKGQTWQILGQTGSVATYTQQATLALNSAGIPYVGFVDYTNANAKAAVMKLDSTAWEYVGADGFSDSSVSGLSIAIGKNDTPYVAYIDITDSNSITVKKFDGANWLRVGARAFSGPTDAIVIALDKSGIPYVAFTDEFDSYKASVMKYTGTAWVYVGNRGISTSTAGVGSLVFDSANQPYVAYADAAHSGKATAMKFSAGNWVTLGTAGFTDTASSAPGLVIDNTGTPYIVYTDAVQVDYKLNVMKFDGSVWLHVGPPGFSPGDAGACGIAMDKNDVPYIVFQDDSDLSDPTTNSTSVMKFNGSNWEYVGDERFSNCWSDGNSIAIDSTGTPYVLYAAENAPPRIIVEKYTTPTGVLSVQSANPLFEIYPNPTNSILEIVLQNLPPDSWRISISDISGQTLRTQTINLAIKNELDVSSLPAGLYFIKLQDGQQSLVRKFVKE